jgi:hypothetical protein
MENRFYIFWGRLSQANPSSLTQEEMLAIPKQTDPQSITQNWSTERVYFGLADQFVVKGTTANFGLSSFSITATSSREKNSMDGSGFTTG